MPSDIPTDQFEADFDAVSARNSVTFTHAGQTGIVGIPSERRVREQNLMPGVLEEYDFAITVLMSDFNTPPAVGDTFTALNSASYRVMSIRISPDALVGEFQLDTIHK